MILTAEQCILCGLTIEETWIWSWSCQNKNKRHKSQIFKFFLLLWHVQLQHFRDTEIKGTSCSTPPKFSLPDELRLSNGWAHFETDPLRMEREWGNSHSSAHQANRWEMGTIGGPFNKCVKKNSAYRADFFHPQARRHFLLGYEGHSVLRCLPWIYPLISCLENWVTLWLMLFLFSLTEQ